MRSSRPRSFRSLFAVISIALAITAAFAQTQPNLENGFKPYGSYDGSHLDTVNLMNGNIMFHAPLVPTPPQRGKFQQNINLYATTKNWTVVCKPDSTAPTGQVCFWSRGGSGVTVQATGGITVHRTLQKSGTTAGTYLTANGYSLTTSDGSTHQLYAVPGHPDPNPDSQETSTVFEAIDNSGLHLELTGFTTDTTYNNVATQAVVTDRSGTRYSGVFSAPKCGRFSTNSIQTPQGQVHQPVIDDSPFGDLNCSQNAYLQIATDSNGNSILFGGFPVWQDAYGTAGPTPTDTMGRPPQLEGITVVTDFSRCTSSRTIVMANTRSYTGPDGNPYTVLFCFANIDLQTAFSQTGVAQTPSSLGGGSTASPVMQLVSVILPDNTNWAFDYDNYANLIYIGLPTGGSIRYTWTEIGYPNCSTQDHTQVSRAVKTRTLVDAQGNSSTWTYFWGVASPSSLTNYVTDPLGNDTVHVFTALDNPNGTAQKGCGFYETSTRTYQGSQNGGTLMKQVDTQYSSLIFATDLGDAQVGNAVATSIKTTLANGKVNLVTRQYDQGLGTNAPIFGNVTVEKQFDWGQGNPGALLRETHTTFRWQIAPAYFTANLLDLPSYVSVIGSAADNIKGDCHLWTGSGSGSTQTTGPCASETQTFYDEAAPQASGITTQHNSTPPLGVRGNPSTVKKSLGATGYISSQTVWYDTGEVYQKIDPLGHTSTITYDPYYVGAYATQTCSPNTAGANNTSVAHCVSGTYDFQTGVLTSFTNENAVTQASGNTPGDDAHTSLYGYDSMFRLKVAQAPPDPANGGARATNNFNYSTTAYPWTVTRTRPVTNALTDSVTTTFDGLGRPIKVQHAMPSGPPSTVDTTYDVLGRVASVSNPYFTTGDPTYGITQTIYDALDRPILVQKPDGSLATTTYQDNCTIVEDEAAKGRRTCSDPLGRLLEVEEPGDASAPPPTDMSSTTSTNAMAVVAISGAVQTLITPPPPCPRGQICDPTPDTSYDFGTVAITVNGHSTSISYQQGDTATSLASRLATAISNDAQAFVNGAASGQQVILSARTTGQSGDAYTASFSTTWDTSTFTRPSFSALVSNNSRLLGGADLSQFANVWLTLYNYDVFGNLLCVEQHGNSPAGPHGDGTSGTGCGAAPSSDATSTWRVRRFSYDSASRLLTASNPESGLIQYAYDADSNLLQKTSPRANEQPGSLLTQTISYCYDQLHRPTGKAYSAQTCVNNGTQLPAGTVIVSYTYDNGADQKGHLTHLADQAGSADFLADSLGRLTQETRVLTGANNASISKSISYEYELGGSVRTLHYPSGAAITYTPWNSGTVAVPWPQQVVDSANNINYATGATYQADGQMTGFISGNTGTFAGITNAFSYNRRLQPINMAANAPSQTVFSIGYDFNLGNGTSGTDNGNVYHIYNFRDRTRDQTFGYDGNNRLISAQNAGTDCTQQVLGGNLKFWGNTYSYDAWGNLNNKTKPQQFCAGENLGVVVGGSNRITSSGYGYDIAGNMTTDGTELVSLHYDPENRADTATKAGITTAYTYDADGNRVAKSSGGAGTLYWYMTPGIVGESDLAGTMKSEYVFFNGERVARRDNPGTPNATVAYYFSDHLKTASIVTDSAGNIKNESDYYPWGGELQFLANDSNHYKFTGKERDTETQLDYFGARYYSNGLGRFITPDWAAKPAAVPYAQFADPQSLNLYTYVRNIPTVKTDADGHCAGDECANVNISVAVTTKPQFKSNEKQEGGGYETGVHGQLTISISYHDQPVTNLPVKENVTQSTTKNGEPQSGQLKQAKDPIPTNSKGEVNDDVALQLPTKTPAPPALVSAVEADQTNNVFVSTSTQTLTFPGPQPGQTCSATYNRTLTNAGKNGSPAKNQNGKMHYHIKLSTQHPKAHQVKTNGN